MAPLKIVKRLVIPVLLLAAAGLALATYHVRHSLYTDTRVNVHSVTAPTRSANSAEPPAVALHRSNSSQIQIAPTRSSDSAEPPAVALYRSNPSQIQMVKTNAFQCLMEKKHSTVKRQRCLYTYINTPATKCPDRLIRLGHPTKDGGWSACIKQSGFKQPCVVFSYGIAGSWTFDDDVANNHNCVVHAFDPSIGKPHFTRGKRIHFYDVGLGNKDTLRGHAKDNWPLLTFKTTLAMLGLSKARINMVKMDIEGDEMLVLPGMARDGSLSNVRLLAFEIHIPFHSIDEQADVFAALKDAQFEHYYTRQNLIGGKLTFGGKPNTLACYEMYFYNKKLL